MLQLLHVFQLTMLIVLTMLGVVNIISKLQHIEHKIGVSMSDPHTKPHEQDKNEPLLQDSAQEQKHCSALKKERLL